MTLHTFVDASQSAYGTAVYARYEYIDGNVTSTLVAAKSHVAPLNAVSIPRLELMGAISGLRLCKYIGAVMEVPSQDCTFWSDSMDVLHRVRGHSRHFKPFVANCVSKIQESTEPSQWRHVPTVKTPQT